MVLGAIRVKPSHTPDRRPGKTERLSCSWWMKTMHFGLRPTLCVKEDLKKLMEIYLSQRINLDTAHKRISDVGNRSENKRALYVIGDTLKKQNKAKQNNKNNKKPSSELPGGHCKEKTPSHLESFPLAD